MPASPDVLGVLAQKYAARGWAVFPCEVDGKAPATRSGFKAATTERGQIATWWRKTPYNIGIWTGASSLVVVDLDLKWTWKRWRASNLDEYAEVPDHDTPPISGLATWLDVLAERDLDWDPTYAVVTPSMGVHVYYEYDGEDIHPAVAWRRGIDIRASGSYVVAAGSETERGVYEEIPADLKPLPSWLRELLVEDTRPKGRGATDVPGVVSKGEVTNKIEAMRRAKKSLDT